MPTPSISSIDQNNLVLIKLSKSMTTFNITKFPVSLEVSIAGPKSSYSYSYEAEFVTDQQMQLALTLNKQITGMNREKLTIKFTSAYFNSTDGVQLSKDSVDTPIYPLQTVSGAVEEGGTASSGMLGFTMGIIIMTNALL